MDWRLGVVGSPIAHSLSPQLHARGLELAGLGGTTTRYELDEERAGELRELMGTTFDALSVTMPLKAAAATMCDDVDERAAVLGVVNSLLWRDGRLHGAATDGPGFTDSLRGEFSVEVDNMHVVVIGAGGAAAAIIESLVDQGVQTVVVHARNEERVRRIVQRHANVVDHMVLYRPVDLVVNTTPAPGRRDVAAVMQGVSPDTIAVDITYEPRTSPWLALHADLGCPHSNGLAMLAYQAARQMNWWWGSSLRGSQLLEVLR